MGSRHFRHDALSAAGALGLLSLLGRVAVRGPAEFDRAVREIARRPRLARTRSVMRPLFVVGLPGGFIPIAYLTARAVRQRGKRGGPAIVTAAWTGWLVHRGAKLIYRRDRPHAPGRERRTDSFPSGHTTGVTTLAVVMAHVLERERLLSAHTASALRYGVPGLMGVYRVLADDHWASDVVAGWLLGSAAGTVVCTCEELWRRALKPAVRSE